MQIENPKITTFKVTGIVAVCFGVAIISLVYLNIQKLATHPGGRDLLPLAWIGMSSIILGLGLMFHVEWIALIYNCIVLATICICVVLLFIQTTAIVFLLNTSWLVMLFAPTFFMVQSWTTVFPNGIVARLMKRLP